MLVAQLALYGLLGLAAASALLGRLLREAATRRAAQAKTLPTATVPNPRRQFVRRVAPVLGSLAFLAGAWQVHRHSIDVVIFDAAPAGPVATRRVYLGARDHYTSQPRDENSLGISSYPTWIVHQSGRPLTVEVIGYGERHSWPSFKLAPGSLVDVASVDYIGPDDLPPESIEVSQSKQVADLHVTGRTRTWVTWK
jgi:hypothetical protein